MQMKPVTPEIKTQIPSLYLRFLREEDAEELSLRVDQIANICGDGCLGLDGAKDTSDQLKFIQRCSEGAATGTAFHYVLLSGDESGLRPSGNSSVLNRIVSIPRRCQRRWKT
jgi:hypothetical protein